VLALGTIVRRWEVELLPETRLVLDPKVTLRPKFPVLVRVRPAQELRGAADKCRPGGVPSCA
jgi:hypothetical protein